MQRLDVWQIGWSLCDHDFGRHLERKVDVMVIATTLACTRHQYPIRHGSYGDYERSRLHSPEAEPRQKRSLEDETRTRNVGNTRFSMHQQGDPLPPKNGTRLAYLHDPDLWYFTACLLSFHVKLFTPFRFLC